MKLIFSKKFAPFFLGQFLGALNDNIFRIAFSTLLTYYAYTLNTIVSTSYTYILSALFIFPFLIFSNICGQICDKFSKKAIILWVKKLEIIISCIAFVGFYIQNIYILFFCVFMLGIHSTLFGPVKYSYLPDHFPKNKLIEPNAWIEMSTFIAILIGSISGTLLAKFSYEIKFIPLIACISLILGVFGYISSQFIQDNKLNNIDLKLKFEIFTKESIQVVYRNKILWLCALAISWLWFLGIIFLNSLFSYSKDILNGNESILTLLLAIFSIGIGIGSICCEKLSKNYIEWGLVPIGAIGISIFTIDLYFSSKIITPIDVQNFTSFISSFHNWHIMLDFFLISFFSGIYSVPLYATMQAHSPEKFRSRVIAVNNILNALAMILASLIGGFWLGIINGKLIDLYLIIAILNIIVVIYIIYTIPTFFIRCIMWIITRLFYNIKVNGEHNIPSTACVIACNHISYMDAIIIGGMIKRPIRFVMDDQIANINIIKFIFRLANVIPIANSIDKKHILQKAYNDIDNSLNNDELICIFPEGSITKNGDIQPLKSGIIKIINRNPVPIIPIAISGMWGSFFSRVEGKAMSKPFRRGFYNKISLNIGKVIEPNNLNLQELREQITALRGDKS